MARASLQEVQFSQQVIAGATPDFDLVDGMEMAFEDMVRTAPLLGSAVRQVQHWTDTSGKLDALEANQKYGLEGTEAAFDLADEEVTEERAKAVAEDYHRLRKSEYIQELVNEESPILGRLTQFSASMGAGFLDPALLAANVGGSLLIGKAVAGLARTAPAINTLGRVSPRMGRAVMTMYDQGVKKSFAQVMAREGLENFAGSLIEETVNFVGVGEERLARDITAQESLMNIAMGTTIGAAFGGAFSPESRKAIARKMGRAHGDSAAELLKAGHIITESELNMGLPKSDFDIRMHERDSYAKRPWQTDDYTFSPITEHTGRKYFIPMNEDGSIHSVSYRGRGTVLTDNIVHAQNKGAKFLEVNADDVRILRRDGLVNAEGGHTTIGKNLAEKMHNHIVEHATPDSLGRAIINAMKIPAEGAELSPSQVKKYLDEVLNGKDIDEMLDFADTLEIKKGTKYDANQVIDDFLESSKWNGYMFTAKKNDGSGAYNGLYIVERSSKKLKKGAVMDSPNSANATFQQKTQWQLEEKKLLEAYDDWRMKNQGKLTDTAPQPVSNPQAPDAPKSEVTKRQEATNEEYRRLKEEIRAKDVKPEAKEGEPAPKQETVLKEEEANAANLAEKKAAGKTLEDMEKADSKSMWDYFKCMIGAQ